MNIFELLFLILFLVSIVALSLAALYAMRGRRVRSISILQGYAIGAAIYFSIVILVSLILPARVLDIGEQLRFDDWSISVEGVNRKVSQSDITYTINLRLSNLAQRAIQREKNLVVYLRDLRGIRYDPIVDSSSVPFSVQLNPTESVIATRTFKLPPKIAVSDLVIDHEGGFKIDWLIIGDGPFREKTMLRLDEK